MTPNTLHQSFLTALITSSGRLREMNVDTVKRDHKSTMCNIHWPFHHLRSSAASSLKSHARDIASTVLHTCLNQRVLTACTSCILYPRLPYTVLSSGQRLLINTLTFAVVDGPITYICAKRYSTSWEHSNIRNSVVSGGRYLPKITALSLFISIAIPASPIAPIDSKKGISSSTTSVLSVIFTPAIVTGIS